MECRLWLPKLTCAARRGPWCRAGPAGASLRLRTAMVERSRVARGGPSGIGSEFRGVFAPHRQRVGTGRAGGVCRGSGAGGGGNAVSRRVLRVCAGPRISPDGADWVGRVLRHGAFEFRRPDSAVAVWCRARVVVLTHRQPRVVHRSARHLQPGSIPDAGTGVEVWRRCGGFVIPIVIPSFDLFS